MVPAEGRLEPIEVSVRFCDDEEIAALNAQWRGKPEPTDVLSFAQFDPPLPTWAPTLGDVVISVDTAARQAKTHGHSLGDEMVILLVHGLLHLLGYDHVDAEQRAHMAQAEQRFLAPRRLHSGLIERVGD